jgi:hypothetical protein
LEVASLAANPPAMIQMSPLLDPIRRRRTHRLEETKDDRIHGVTVRLGMIETRPVVRMRIDPRAHDRTIETETTGAKTTATVMLAPLTKARETGVSVEIGRREPVEIPISLASISGANNPAAISSEIGRHAVADRNEIRRIDDRRATPARRSPTMPCSRPL